MIRRFHEAKVSGAPSVTLWGAGTPRPEFLHVDDLANAACFLMENYDAPDLLNVGVGEDLTIAELAGMVARVVGYDGRIIFDSSRPAGTPCKFASDGVRRFRWKKGFRLRMSGIEQESTESKSSTRTFSITAKRRRDWA
jgi:GDP-L-fucose synthase